METTDQANQQTSADLVSQQTSFIQKQNQVAEIKYKIYAFALLLIGIWFWGILNAAIIQIETIKSDIVNIDSELQILNRSIANDQENKKIVGLAKEQYDDIVNCINKRLCEGITINKDVNKNMDNLRTYYLVNQLSGNKMTIDQKLILRAIDDYLLKKNDKSIGQIQSITYGDPVTVNEEKNIYKLPLNVQVEFFNKDDFVSFILNSEKYLDPALRYRVFFKIVSMNYNIANYESLQKVTMVMEVFYYR